MTTGATGQLGLALPVQGELSGTWGDTVNNGLTQYINIAIAGTLTLTNDGAVTLANTTGDASASNVTSTLTGAGTVTAQFAIVRVTGTLTVAKVVTGPSYSKTYTVVNAATGGIVTFKAAGQTGVSVAVGESAFVYFNGTDYVKVSGTASVTSFSAGTTGLTPSTSTTGAVTLAGTLAIANGGTGQTTANTALNALLPSQTGNANKYLQTDGTNSSWDAVSLSTADITGTLGTANGGTGLTSFTSGGVVYASSTSALATGSALTFDGTNLGAGGASSPSAPVDIQANSGATAIRIRGRASANAGTLRFFANDNTTQRARFESNDTSFEINSIANLPITFLTNDTEAMRLTSTSLYTASGINVGIGTSSPAQKLDVSGSGTISARVSSTTGNATFILNSASTFYNYLQYSSAGSGGLIFYDATNSVNRMVLDSAGNLGLGVTPSAWEAGYQVFENSGGSFFSGSGSVVRTVQGGYINSGYKYKYTGVAAGLYAMSAGSHQWSTAASGTAGDAISFTQAMTLDASGNLIVGGTSPVISGGGRGNITINGSSTAIMALSVGGTAKGWVYHDNTNMELNAGSSGAMIMYTGGAQRARITSGGDFYVGTTTGTIGTANFGAVISQSGGVFASRNEDGSVVIAQFGGNVGLLRILGNGNAQNTNNSYGAISDVKLKENIVDASPKLADLMQVKVRNYNLIGDTTKQIGVVAQELETVFPAMVNETTDTDAKGNDLGTTTKSVKYSVFVPMLIKAMQEQQAIIESLKARLDAANL